MSLRREFVELAQQEGANRRALCRRFGISPTTGYRWLHRYQAEGAAGLQDRSRRPHHSPHRTPVATEQAVLQIHDTHPAWGGRKIRATLAAQRKAQRLRFPCRVPAPSPPSCGAMTGWHQQSKPHLLAGTASSDRGPTNCGKWTSRATFPVARRTLSSVDAAGRPFALLSRSGGLCQRAPADGAGAVDPDFHPLRVAPRHLDRQWPALGRGHHAPGAYGSDGLVAALGRAGPPWAALPSPDARQGGTLSSHAPGRSPARPHLARSRDLPTPLYRLAHGLQLRAAP